VGTTTYTYQSTTNFNTILPAAGHYALLKGRNLGSPGVAAWFFSPLDDHTSPTDNTKGYFLNFDATQAAGQYYEFDMTGLCEGTDLIFSAWLMNINPTSWTPSGYVVPIVEFIIEDMSGNRLGVFNTGEILKQNAATWVNYAFPFTVPAGVSDVKVRFINAQLKATGTAGNDISIDDIEVRLCAPPITAYVNGKATDTICSGSAVTLTVDPYDDNQVFVPSGTNLKGYWLRSFTGDVNTPTAWTTVSMSEVTGTAVLTVPPVTDTPPANDTVYYRFVISSVANVDKPNCRAYSAVLPVVVRGHTPNYPDVRLQLCSGLTTQIYLSSYLDTVNFTSVVWSKISTGSPNFVGSTANTTGALNTSDFSLGTHIYEYAMSNICSASGTGRVYVKYTTNPVVPSLIDTIVICQSTPSAAHLQLNQMLGLETGGTWSYDVALSSYVTAKTPPSQFAGAYIFDAATAWYEANYGSLSACKITYNGDINAAAFTFNYTTGPQTCFGNRVRKLVLVITSRVLPLH
jgi:hypothetical protein